MNRILMPLYVACTGVGTYGGSIVRYENAKRDYDQRLRSATESWQRAEADYNNRDMSGSRSSYAQRKGELQLRVRSAAREIVLVRSTEPGNVTKCWGALKGAMFPVTVPLHIYRHGLDTAQW